MKPLVRVLWHDARDIDDTWADEDSIEEFSKIDVEVVSVGYLVKETAKYLTIAGDYNASDNDYGRVFKVPVGMVVSRELLVAEAVEET